ncbi:MAG: cob(I)yrinic acid a,c-diamide adenosyltransferase, partial [Candidatus Omnitrophica bacterium]|nr:cob(I)yrinic acid a,c-diamide adenosyltransferase [Candidatus Omnitrophota bacterium]
KKLNNISINQCGRRCFIRQRPTTFDRQCAQKGLKLVQHAMSLNHYQMIILDEITIALYYKLIALDEVLNLIKRVHPKTELILTGRKAPAALIRQADLVSEIREIKHYFRKGMGARKGIEF